MAALAVQSKNSIAENISFSADLFNKWILFIDVNQKSKDTYTRNIRQFYLYLEDNNIDRPTQPDILAYKEHLLKDKKPTTAQAYLMAVKQFFQWTETVGLYPNITAGVKGVRLDAGHKKDYLTSAQTKKVLETAKGSALKDLRDYAIIALMFTTGLRTIEVSRANIEDMRAAGDNMALYVQGKGHQERTDYVKVEPQVEEAIRAYLKARGNADAKAPLFASVAHRNGGQRMTTRSISRIAKEALLAAGYDSDRLTAHSFRHTAATLNLLNGGTPEETMQLLRHSNLNTTLIYSHALERAKNNSEARVAAAIFD